MAGEFVYPKRPKFFAHKFCRVLWKSCAANEIGADACWLLVGIAMTEDARGYRSPVTYFNEQLYPVAGQQNVKGMVRARDRAVAAGWLAYRPGGKGVAGKYFVTLPPEHGDWDDLPTDEGCVSFPDTTPILSKEAGEKREGSGVRSGREVGNQTGEKRERSGNHSSLVLSPIPSPIPNTPLPPTGGESVRPKRIKPVTDDHPHFARFWLAYPKRKKRPDAERAFAKLNPDDALLDAMLTALAWQSRTEDWVKESGRFIPHPASWINARQWEDEPTVSPPPPAPRIVLTELTPEQLARIRQLDFGQRKMAEEAAARIAAEGSAAA